MKKANVPPGLDPNLPDNKIIGVAGELAKNQESKVVVITKDINFRVKCDALVYLQKTTIKTTSAKI